MADPAAQILKPAKPEFFEVQTSQLSA